MIIAPVACRSGVVRHCPQNTEKPRNQEFGMQTIAEKPVVKTNTKLR